VHLLVRTKDEGSNKECFHALTNAVRTAGNGNASKLGSLFKDKFQGPFIATWLQHVEDSTIEKVEITPPIGHYFAKKDPEETECIKKACILSNKVMKHGFVNGEMEKILDSDEKKSHEAISVSLEEILQDPTKIGVKISSDVVDSTYSPIIQSGSCKEGYDIKVNAASDSANLSPDIIICSLGARYRGYCASITRTYVVNGPPKVEKTYATLLQMYNVCIETMIQGKKLKDVMAAAKDFLKDNDASLLPHLPRNFGFAIGLEFRDSTLLMR
jgi:nucleosome binding factor SPN SPT16 subunit